jgi:putative ABC transport system permease protein
MTLVRDLRLTLRGALNERGYAAAVITTLALTIGANTAIFSAVYAVLLNPLPISRPEELLVCWATDPSHHLAVVELSYKNFEDWAANSRSFARTAAVGSSTWPGVLEGRGEPVKVSTAGVSASFFDTLGARPDIGRGFTPKDDEPNGPQVAILSHAIWASRFGSDPAVVGSIIQMDGKRTIVGIMPKDFDYPRGTDFWIPVRPVLVGADGTRPDALRNVGVLFVVGRLRHGVSLRMARDELDLLAAQMEQAGTPRFGKAVVVTPFLDHLLGPVRQALWALLATVAVLLLIGCANVSGLMLTRVSLRRREQAIRLALGATRADLGRRWILETLALSAAGGALGLATSHWMAQAIVALAPEDIPRLSNVAINLPVAAFTLVAVAATAVLCGVAPVRQASSSTLVEALNDAARATPGRRSGRTRTLLLVFQMALTVVLLVTAGLVLRSFINLRSLHLGFVPSNVLSMNLSSPRSSNAWMAEVLRRVQALPGVEAAGAVYLRPLALGPIGQETGVLLEGQVLESTAADTNPALNYEVATAGYFSAMRIRLLEGRLFDDRDRADAPRVALVGVSAARRLWPGDSAIGKRMLMPTYDPAGPETAWRTVVGVVSDVRYRGLDDVRLDVYDAPLQSHLVADDLQVRTTADPLRMAALVQAEARRFDPAVLFEGVTTMEAIVDRAAAPWRFSVWMFGLFAALAFALATFGLFSVVSLDTARRRHEFAIRLALGASPRHVVGQVLLAVGWKVVIGVTFGVACAAAGTRAVRSILFGVSPLDAGTYAGVMMLIAVVGLLASYVPARRAAGADPLALLRRGE